MEVLGALNWGQLSRDDGGSVAKVKRAGRPTKDPADAGRKYRLYPTPQQAERLSKWGHTCRAVWNVALEQRLYVYKQRRKYLRADEQCRYLTQARHDLEWIGDLPSQVPQQVLRHLDQAYENFWNAEHPAGFPRFKKRTSRLAIPLPEAKRHRGGKYSNRLRRTLRAIAELKARQARRRSDFAHKLTTDLAKNHGLVAIEDLRVKQMTRSARGTHAEPGMRVSQKAGLNRAVLDNLPGERRRQLVYKCAAYGSELVLVQPARTSQTCGACKLWDPASRISRDTFVCTGCGHADDADHNASVVILSRALHDRSGTAIAAGQCGEQHAPTGRARPVMSRTRAGRTREPLNPSSAVAEPSADTEGYKESQQVTAGRMSKNKRVSGHARDTPKLSG